MVFDQFPTNFQHFFSHHYDNYKTEEEEGHFLFENSINTHDMEDNDTNIYLRYLTQKLNSLSENINVELRHKSNHNSKMISLLIWAIDKNKKSHTQIIGL